MYILFLFTMTSTGIYAWVPVIAKNIDHSHELSIVNSESHTSNWSLDHDIESHDSNIEDSSAHDWLSYGESTNYHDLKPIQLKAKFISDPIFLIYFALAISLFFLSLFEKPIRSFEFRKRIFFFNNSYTISKKVIVLRN